MSECNRTFGGFCCTFIPNNTSPDGSITRGPNSSLGRWLKTENPFGDTMRKWSGQWNGILTSLVMFPAVGAALLTLWACCSIPCIHEWLGRAEGKTWMQENLNGNLWTVPLYSSQWCRIIDLSVKSLVSLLQESNRLFSTPTKTLSSLTSVQRLNFSDRFDRSDDLLRKWVFLCSSQRWFHSRFQWCKWLSSRCWWIVTWENKNLHESYPSFVWSLKIFSSSSSIIIILLLWSPYLYQRNIYFLQNKIWKFCWDQQIWSQSDSPVTKFNFRACLWIQIVTFN